jgi:hypothetical protein
VLHEEEPVVEKRGAGRACRLQKDTVTDEREVSEQFRKEWIEHEGDSALSG